MPSSCGPCWPLGIDFDPYAEWGAGPDVIHDVQSDLITEWLADCGGCPADAAGMAELVARCSVELILPAGQIATVLKRTGRTELAGAYLDYARNRPKMAKQRAGQAAAQRYRESKGVKV